MFCIPEHRKHKSHQAQMDHRLCPYVPVQQDHCGHRVSHVLIIKPSLFLSWWLSQTIQTTRTNDRREEEARQVSSAAPLDRSQLIIPKTNDRGDKEKRGAVTAGVIRTINNKWWEKESKLYSCWYWYDNNGVDDKKNGHLHTFHTRIM